MRYNNFLKPVVIFLGCCLGFVTLRAQAPQQTKGGQSIVDLKIKHNAQFGANYDAWKVDFLEARTPRAIDAPGFPRYVDTGNPILDDAVYAAAKSQWIASNDAAYDEAVRGEAPNTLRRTIHHNDGTTTYLVGMGSFFDQQSAAAFDQKVLNQLGVVSVTTNHITRVCNVRIKTVDEHNVMSNVFGVTP